MDKIRSWLESNKIFFEVSAALLVSIASIIISYASLMVSKEQLRTSELIAEPYFYIEQSFQNDSKTNDFDTEVMKIYNSGSPAYNMTIDVQTFIRIRRYDTPHETAIIPTTGYYQIHNNHQNQVGHISTLIAKGSNSKASELELSLRDVEIVKKYGFVSADFFSVTKISGTDRLGRKFSYYYNDRQRIREEEAEHLWPIGDDVSPLYFAEATTDSLMSKYLELKKRDNN